eukprot:11220649-Lingulodinium_polyedra.AAC.1
MAQDSDVTVMEGPPAHNLVVEEQFADEYGDGLGTMDRAAHSPHPLFSSHSEEVADTSEPEAAGSRHSEAPHHAPDEPTQPSVGVAVSRPDTPTQPSVGVAASRPDTPRQPSVEVAASHPDATIPRKRRWRGTAMKPLLRRLRRRSSSQALERSEPPAPEGAPGVPAPQAPEVEPQSVARSSSDGTGRPLPEGAVATFPLQMRLAEAEARFVRMSGHGGVVGEGVSCTVTRSFDQQRKALAVAK